MVTEEEAKEEVVRATTEEQKLLAETAQERRKVWTWFIYGWFVFLVTLYAMAVQVIFQHPLSLLFLVGLSFLVYRILKEQQGLWELKKTLDQIEKSLFNIAEGACIPLEEVIKRDSDS